MGERFGYYVSILILFSVVVTNGCDNAVGAGEEEFWSRVNEEDFWSRVSEEGEFGELYERKLSDGTPCVIYVGRKARQVFSEYPSPVALSCGWR